MRPPLLLTGGPAAGKSATAAGVASTRLRAAVVDVDDIRHLVVTGHAAPWEGVDGEHQQRLGVENACGLARRLTAYGFEVILADLVTPATLTLYRSGLPGVLVVGLEVSQAEATRRAGTRPVHLSEAEFVALHEQSRADPPAADAWIEANQFTLAEQVRAATQRWARVGVRGGT